MELKFTEGSIYEARDSSSAVYFEEDFKGNVSKRRWLRRMEKEQVGK